MSELNLEDASLYLNKIVDRVNKNEIELSRSSVESNPPNTGKL